MRILLTGASGFLGNVIKDVLSDHDIFSLGRNNADIECDLSIRTPSLPQVHLVIHAAGKAHSVPATEKETREFYDINVNGTRNLLTALSACSILPSAFVFISSVAVYGKDSGEQITEDYPLLATDPYGQSKIMAESLVQQWCDKNNVTCGILRLPLLAGSNPPGNLKSMIRGINKGYYLDIAGGCAKKSIVLAKDVASVIPTVAKIGGIFNLTDGYHPTFAELALRIAGQLNKPAPKNIPGWLANIIAKVGDVIGRKSPLTTKKLKKITSNLTFNDKRAVDFLFWNPTSVVKGLDLSEGSKSKECGKC